MSEWGIDLNCLGCEYYPLELSEFGTCKAFPEGIPHAIVSGEFDHRKLFKGDKGIVYLKREPKSKSLTPDHKRAHWDLFAQKTERQEVAFKRVFEDIFAGQKKFVVEQYQKTGQLPDGLNDKQTAQKFQSVIELVYDSAFEDAVASKTVKQLDEFARGWIAERSLLLAKSINITTLKAVNDLVASFEAGTTVVQAAKKIEHWFAENEKWKAEMVARTETIAVNNEAVLHRFELEGVGKSEWLASPLACDECEPENGKVYLTKESHNLIPKHPNCRCMWLGVVD